MPDISMCANSQECKKKETCHRATAVPSEPWQSQSNFYTVDKECEYYWNDEGKRRKG